MGRTASWWPASARIRVGPIVGNDYPVLEGLKPGDQVVVSGSQKLVEGAPIAPAPETPLHRRHEVAELPPLPFWAILHSCNSAIRDEPLMIVDTFIRRPILASVCSLVIILAGAMAIPTLPIAQFPELAPPTVTVNAFYQGASAEVVETAVTTPIEQALNGVEGMQYMTSSSGSDGIVVRHGDLRRRSRHRRGGG